MNKTLLFLLFNVLIITVAYSQDTIVRTNGAKISCKIQNEDSISVFFSVIKGGHLYNTSINKTDVISVKYGEFTTKSITASFNDRDAVIKLDLILPALGLEFKLPNYNTILFSYQPGFAFIQINQDPTQRYIVNQFRGSTRFFYDINSRIARGKITDKFSGDFFSLFAMTGLKTAVSPNYVTFGATWGLQRNWGDVLHFSFEIGAGYSSEYAISPISMVGDLKLGFSF